jgi:hypothetical protein
VGVSGIHTFLFSKNKKTGSTKMDLKKLLFSLLNLGGG